MAEAPTLTASGRLWELAGRLDAHRDFAEVITGLQAGHSATFDGVWGSSCALVSAGLARHAAGPLVIVVARPTDIEPLCDDLSLFGVTGVERFSPLESSRGEHRVLDDAWGERLRILKSLNCRQGKSTDTPPLIVTSVQALMQGVPDRTKLASRTRRVKVGEEVDVKELVRWLVEQGLHNSSAVELPGEFSRRGGIIDVFAPDWFDPVRLEFFGDQLESIRRFEVSSQRSLESLDSIDVTVLETAVEGREHLAAYLPQGSWFLLVEPADIEEEARHALQRTEQPDELHSLASLMQQIARFPSATAAGIAPASLEATCRLRIESVERFSGDINKVREELDSAAGDFEMIVACPTEAEIQRLNEIFGGTRLATDGRLHFTLGRLQSGFRLVPERLVLISSAELFHRTDLRRLPRRRLGRVIDSFLDLREGDYVVHLAHGIGRYRGLKVLEKNQQIEEHLELEFAGGTKIFVPTSNIELVQKYVGGNKGRPTLAKIGGRQWSRQREAAQKAVTDLAVDMLQLQAVRAARPGIMFPPDTTWQQEFDASFPYDETPDQLSAIAAIKKDMREPRPMDRLLCGDVGFGKTEVAARGAFKAVESGYQVAILVPTTILAEQHRRTFTSRMAEFPFQIAALSRFNSAREEKRILEGLQLGSIDLVIGTHRLAQEDIKFQNLGLVIIDEEQRFGVEVKERLKALRQTVDVLTMTATPIPRTLHMSLLGLRDISNLETPPEDRLAVETKVARFDPELVRHAVMRELNRDGQIYFVHNRVHDIEKVAWELSQIVPEATINTAHGQMAEGQLERVMLDFIDHRFDILLATTIIESGLDIPNVNTILIDDADQYGLADLHQLRGRVGRYKHRAYCYLLVNPNRHLSPNAARRLRAIEEFSDIGAGFAIAMRDLEIRGAGNILGTQQSGHIAAVGYELYCQLLEQSVRKLKKMPPRESIDVHVDLPIEAYLPTTYLPDMRTKIDIYRRLARVARDDELADLVAEMIDRFGALPPPVERLVMLAELRIAAAHWRVDSIHLETEYAVLGYSDRRRIQRLAAQSAGQLRIVDQRSAYLPLAERDRDGLAILGKLKSLLRAG